MSCHLTRVVSALTLFPTLLCAQGAFTDRVVATQRPPTGSGLVTGAVLIDDDGDGAVDLWIANRGANRVERHGGWNQPIRSFAGPSGTGFGGLVMIGNVFAPGQNVPVICSTTYGHEHVAVIANDTTGTQLAGGPLPAGETGLRWAGLIQADADPQLEVAYSARGFSLGLGRIGIFDAQTNSFRPLVDGDSATDEFGTAATVVRDPVGGDHILVSAPGADKIFDVDLSGNKTLIATLPPGSNAGRHGITDLGNGRAVISSGLDVFMPQPNGRLDILDIQTGQVTPVDPGAPNQWFGPATPPDATGRFFYTRRTTNLAEEIWEASATTAPQLAVQAPPGTGLQVLGRHPFWMSTVGQSEVLAVAQASPFATVSIYRPDADLDCRVEQAYVSSGSSATVHFDFGPSCAGGLVFPVLSISMPSLVPVPALGIQIAVTPDAMTNNSLAGVPGWPFLADAAGSGSFQVPVPTPGFGGATLPFSYGVVGFAGGVFFGSHDAATNKWILN
ncbi:MAG: hypothetical protein H6838_11450 [Planctomycetes bacterium]|nr:hypothetical protein [Planctomycetota bacterium]MCB9886100.1 hypothetical protein [Planctomycetota bacterium]